MRYRESISKQSLEESVSFNLLIKFYSLKTYTLLDTCIKKPTVWHATVEWLKAWASHNLRQDKTVHNSPYACIETEKYEVAEVVSTNTGAEEEAVVVPLVNTSVTQGTVVAPLRLVYLAGRTVAQLLAVIMGKACCQLTVGRGSVPCNWETKVMRLNMFNVFFSIWISVYSL